MERIEGEASQAKGADGARRAKRWLESTTRADARWINPDPAAKPKLTFAWPEGGQNFSFDVGGILKYGDFDGQMFFAESKNYDTPKDLGDHYYKYLAQCYVAFQLQPQFCDHFMWIAWSPHLVTRWDELMTPEIIAEAVVKHRGRIFPGKTTVAEATALINQGQCVEVANRLWLIVLSKRQEALVISPDHRALVDGHEIKKAG